VESGSDEENHHGHASDQQIRNKLKTFVAATGVFRPAKVTDRLIEECGSAAAVFGAPKYRIASAVGCRSPVNTALRTARWLSLHCFEEQAQHRPLINNSRALLSYVGNAMAQDTREIVRVLYVTIEHRLLKVEVAYKGGFHSAQLEPRYVLKRALELGAAGLILVHNHPSGNPEPSGEDRRITSKIGALCAEFDIHLIDHIVVSLQGARSVIWDRDLDIQ
jgi:DNA repair protein RadC